MEHKSGFVAVVGRPNVGKSTLLNKLVGQKIAIVSPKPQTTRNRIQAVMTVDGGQVVFLDTPGLHRPQHRLGEYMVQTARQALKEVDLVLMVTDVTRWKRADDYIVGELTAGTPPVILVANKTDLATTDKQEEFLMSAANRYTFSDIMFVSAKNGDNVDALVTRIMGMLPEGPKYYPDDWLTDHPEQFVVTELIREQILLLTEQEVPHSVAVVIDEMVEEQNQRGPLVRIRATIFVERDSQKGIIIGKNGLMLKRVGSSARKQIERLLGAQVFLDLWVKVKKDWREKLGTLREFGYQ